MALHLPSFRWLAPLIQSKGLPLLSLEEMPRRAASILSLVRETELNADGLLLLKDLNGKPSGTVPLAPTDWNKENSKRWHRLKSNHPWAIVLHWYGDRPGFDATLTGYLRGFNSLRLIDGLRTQTSAHFLVGDEVPVPSEGAKEDSIGIIQTQAPDKDGTPFLAAHVLPLNIEAHKAKQQYFVRAWYQVNTLRPGAHSLLQSMYDGPRVDPNTMSIAIEITGSFFESPEFSPGDQKVANVVSLVWALMKHYQIPAANLLGHHELQLGKADPGKKFMALVRYIIGLKALQENDEQMLHLVFGRFLDYSTDLMQAASDYFQTIRDYLVLVGTESNVYEWEAQSGFWFAYDRVSRSSQVRQVIDGLQAPLGALGATYGFTYLKPANHDGVDLFVEKTRSQSAPRLSNVLLAANGRCLYLGETRGHAEGKVAIFRHRQPDGAEIISMLSHLNSLNDLTLGAAYPVGTPIGTITSPKSYVDPYTHFSLAYSAAWDRDKNSFLNPPLNANETWIRLRYLDPIQYLKVYA